MDKLSPFKKEETDLVVSLGQSHSACKSASFSLVW